jgi:hypothetical protein
MPLYLHSDFFLPQNQRVATSHSFITSWQLHEEDTREESPPKDIATTATLSILGNIATLQVEWSRQCGEEMPLCDAFMQTSYVVMNGPLQCLGFGLLEWFCRARVMAMYNGCH